MSNIDEFSEERKELDQIKKFSNRFKLLGSEEEYELTVKIYNLRNLISLLFKLNCPLLLYYTVIDFDRAATELENKNLRLVLKFCQSPAYIGRGYPMYDMFIEGWDGLRYASRVKYDPFRINPKNKKNYKFSTCASLWIKQRIGRSVNKKGSIIKIAGHKQDDISKIKVVVKAFVSEFGYKPTAETIADLINIKFPNKNITSGEVAELGRLTWHIQSLDEFTSSDENSLSLIDYMKANPNQEPESVFLEKQRKEIIDNLLSQLEDNERFIIVSRFGLIDHIEKSDKRICKLLGINQKLFKSLELSALEKIKQLAPEDLRELINLG